MSIRLMLAVSALCFLFRCYGRPVGGEKPFSIAVTGDTPFRTRITFTTGGEKTGYDSIVLYRSTMNIAAMKTLNRFLCPITRRRLSPVTDEFCDSFVAPGTVYSYYAVGYHGSQKRGSTVQFVRQPDRVSPPLTTGNPLLIVDKMNYILDVVVDGETVQRYPLVMWSNPFFRKTWRDRASTPEGIYRITWIDERSSFHRSLHLSYPEDGDRQRYNSAATRGDLPSPDTPIGGSITFHGGGLGYNWTWGCLALRNDDIDELIDHWQVSAKSRVIITGYTFTRDSLATAAGFTPRLCTTR